MFQADSLYSNTEAGVGREVRKYRYEPTPAQILSWYSPNLTEAQKDSVIQLHTKPKTIRWSECPDTLHLPGHEIGRSVFDTSLPQYYKDNFFSDKPYYHPEITGGRQGVAGDPIPYTVAGDSVMTSVLLLCFLATAVVVSASLSLFGRQLKSIFYGERGNTLSSTETSREIRFQVFLVAEACLMYGIMYLQYLKNYVSDTFAIEQFQVIGLFSAVFAGYYLAKWVLYSVVGWVFFDDRQNKQWAHSYLYLAACLSLVAMPAIYVQLYFDLSFRIWMIYMSVVVILSKLLAILRLYHIFFFTRGKYLGFFLYFCTLELMPLGVLWSILRIISGYLKINF